MLSPQSQVEDIIRPIKKPPKTRSDYDIQLIQQATKSIPFFAKYITEGKEDVHLQCCKHITYEEYDEGKNVFEAGESGTKFYIILGGKVGIYIKYKNEMKKVKELCAGESFGELALVNDAPRSATIKCLKVCHFAVLGKKSYIMLFEQIISQEIKKEVSFYPEIELFSHWNFNKIKSFYTSSFRIKVKKGDKIINEGDPIDAIYIVTSGEFVVSINSFDSVKKQKSLEGQFNDQNISHQMRRKSVFVQTIPQVTFIHLLFLIKQLLNQMQLFLMPKYEFFGQEFLYKEKENFFFSVECHSFEGNLIYIKVQDYKRIILSDELQKNYMNTYSEGRIKRIEDRIREISNTLIKPENVASPIITETQVSTPSYLGTSNQHPNNINFDEVLINSLKNNFLSPMDTPTKSSFNRQSELGGSIEAFQKLKLLPPANNSKQTISRRNSMLSPLISIKFQDGNNKNNEVETRTKTKSTHESPEFNKKSFVSIENSESSKQSFSNEKPKEKFFTFNLKAINSSLNTNLKNEKNNLFEIQSKKDDNNKNSDQLLIKKQGSKDNEQESFSKVVNDSLSLVKQSQLEESDDFSNPKNDIQNNYASTNKGLKVALQFNQKDFQQFQKEKNKNQLNEDKDNENLHPLLKAFHDQLKIKFYNKFKRGKIEDLKQHLNYAPIQTLKIDKKEVSLKAQSYFLDKKQKDKRFKDVREYEAKLQLIIKNESSLPVSSISPLKIKNIKSPNKKEADSATKGGLSLPFHIAKNQKDQAYLNSQLHEDIVLKQETFNQKQSEFNYKSLNGNKSLQGNYSDQLPEGFIVPNPNSINESGYIFGKFVKHKQSCSSTSVALPKEELTNLENQRIHSLEKLFFKNSSSSNLISAPQKLNENELFQRARIQSPNFNQSEQLNNFYENSILPQNRLLSNSIQLKLNQRQSHNAFVSSSSPLSIKTENLPQLKKSNSQLNFLLASTPKQEKQKNGYFQQNNQQNERSQTSSLFYIPKEQDVSQQTQVDPTPQNQKGCQSEQMPYGIGASKINNSNGLELGSTSSKIRKNKHLSNHSKFQFNIQGGFKGKQGFNCSQFNLRKDKDKYYNYLQISD